MTYGKMNSLIRPATSADLPYILATERAAATAAHWLEVDYTKTLTETSPRRILLVAECSQQVQGFLVARSVYSSEWEIENVVVAESVRRIGLGTALLQAFIQRVRAERTQDAEPCAIFLEVSESNLSARQLYEKSGLQLITSRHGYYSHPAEEAILYRIYFQ